MELSKQAQPFLNSKKWNVALMLALAAFSLVILFADAPNFQPIPDRDSGGFYYIGQQMLHGQRLYADLFDVKPPFIFFVNALGLWLGGGSAWGVWALESVSLVATVLLGFSLLSSASGVIPALFAMLVFLGNFLRILLGGNFTEEYALPFQFLILICVLPADLGRPLRWRAFFAGLAWGVVFFFKQNFWGIGLAVGLFLLFRWLIQWKKSRFWEVLWYAAGFLAMCLLVAAYFWAIGALGSLWDAAFVSNFAYITISPDYTRIDLFLRTMNEVALRGPWIVAMPYAWLAFLQLGFLAPGPFARDSRRWPAWLTYPRRFGLCLVAGILLIFGILSGDILLGRPAIRIGLLQWIAIIVCLELILFGLLQWIGPAARWIRLALTRAFSSRLAVLTALACLAFFLDLVSIGLSGKFFSHYFLMLFPSGAVMTAAFAAVLLSISRPTWLKMVAILAVAAAFVPVGLIPLAHMTVLYKVNHDVQRETVVAFITAHTQPNEQVLMWGGEPGLNFVSQRTRPNRFVFMSQLFLEGYTSSALADEMLDDLQTHPPELIVDSRDCAIPFESYLTNGCKTPPSYWNGVFNFVRQNYLRLDDLGPDQWRIYQLKK